MAAYEEEGLQIVLEDEDGAEHYFDVIGTFYFEGKDYMGLHPIESEMDNEVILIGFRQGPEDSVIFEDITDDEEYERAARVFEDLFNEDDEIGEE